jgi:hypothetical protein
LSMNLILSFDIHINGEFPASLHSGKKFAGGQKFPQSSQF